VLGEGLRLAGLGLVAGLALALAGGRVLRSQLYGVGSADPTTYLVLSAVLVLVAGIACWVPARRATRVDPAIALRAE
jgi:putative ABC transport system permease protein